MKASAFIKLLSGGMLAQLVTIAAVPLLGRLYGPAEFGELGAVIAVVSLASVVVHGRYQMAIPVAENEQDAQALLAVSCVLTLVLTVPVVVCICLVAVPSMSGMAAVQLAAVAIVITWLTAIIDVLNYWRSHSRRFGVTARNAVIRSISTVATQLAIGPISAAGLLMGTVVGSGVAAIAALADVRRHDSKRLGRVSLSNFVEAISKYRAHPLYGVPQGWLAALSWNAMPLLLLKFGGAATAGQYWLAYRLLIAPVSLFNGSYRHAILPALRDRDARQGRMLVVRHSILIAACAVIPVVAMFLAGAELFELIVGPAWRAAGTIAGWMAIGILGDLSKIPAMCLLQSHHHHRTIFAWESVLLVLRYGTAIPFLLRGDHIAAIAAFSVLGLLGWLTFTIVQLFPARRHQSQGKEE